MKYSHQEMSSETSKAYHTWQAKDRKAWRSGESCRRMPPLLPVLNILHFPDLPSATRALQTPALLQNNGQSQATFLSITKQAIDNYLLVVPGKQFDLRPQLETSKNIIAHSYDSSFNDFLGEYTYPLSVVPPFDEILLPPQSVPNMVSGTLLLSYW